jgi:hypothetical protein
MRRLIKRTKLVKGTNPRSITRKKAIIMIKARDRKLPVITTREGLIAAGLLKAGR